MTPPPSTVEAWIADDPDPITRDELAALVRAGDTAALEERFTGRLRFGTAGLRGPLRAGPAGMNRAVVGRATLGLAAYLRHRGLPGPVVIGHDARHGSAAFARDSAELLAGAGFDVRMLPAPQPTPLLAFAVRRLRAAAGVMVTASHNPVGDNGYKVYLGDPSDPAGFGAQVVPPADAAIEAEIGRVDRLCAAPRSREWTSLDVFDPYLEAVARLPRGPHREISIAYTPLHGVGGAVLAEAMRRAGFPTPLTVPEQAGPDPDFPTTPFPNPEEPGVLDRVLALAERTGADLAIANDPDADRCAVACRGRVLTGDEVGVLLADHLMRAGVHGRYATTVVSSSLLAAMCADRGLPYAETLTGFKWISRAGVDLVFGYEEALGYAVAPGLVRDKDGISAALLVADLAATLKAAGTTLLDRLDEIAAAYGVHLTAQVSVPADDTVLRRLRKSPPAALLGTGVSSVDSPGPDVVRLLANGLRLVVRPSGTEPKLKAYLQVVGADRAAATRRLAALRAQTVRLLAP